MDVVAGANIFTSEKLLFTKKDKCMLSAKDIAVIFETLLASPGMGDAVKVSIIQPRKLILLLVKAIDSGLKNREDSLLAGMDAGTVDAIKAIADELLKKAGLTELNEKISLLTQK